MKKIKQIFKKIESSSKFIHEYKWEEKERKVTRKGAVVAEENRTQNIIIVSLSNKNSIENAFLKFKAMQFYLYLLEAESFCVKQLKY